jgi:predicted DNA-binding protein (UPF0251 family)
VPLTEVVGEIALTLEELEAIRLTDLEGLTQQEAGEKMNISQPTISRHLEIAHRKIAKALVLGLAIRIVNPAHFFHCDQCGHTWPLAEDLSTTKQCERCESTRFHIQSSSNKYQQKKPRSRGRNFLKNKQERGTNHA